MQYIADNLNIFFTKKCIPKTKGTETEHMPGHQTKKKKKMDNAMKLIFEKSCKLIAEKTIIYSGQASCKISKCLLFKMDEKAVRTALPEFFF